MAGSLKTRGSAGLHLAGALAGLSFLLATSSASAQVAVALSRFEPAERGSRFYFADSLELHHPTDGSARPALAFGLVTSYANRARVFGSVREGEKTTLIEHAVYAHPGVAATIAPGARFALDVPVAFQSGEPTNLSGRFYGAPGPARFGDVRFSFDLGLAGPMFREIEGLALAGGVSAWLPTGSGIDYAGDEGTRFGVHLTGVAHYGVLLASLRAGYMYRRDGQLGSSRLGSEAHAEVAVGWATERWTIGPELRASTLLYDPLTTRTTPTEVLVGARRRFTAFQAGAAIGTAVVGGLGAPYLRALLSLEWVGSPATTSIGRLDRDGDGVPDLEDQCPDVPGVEAAGPGRGCPGGPPVTPDPIGPALEREAPEDPCSVEPRPASCPPIVTPAPDPPSTPDPRPILP